MPYPQIVHLMPCHLSGDDGHGHLATWVEYRPIAYYAQGQPYPVSTPGELVMYSEAGHLYITQTRKTP